MKKTGAVIMLARHCRSAATPFMVGTDGLSSQTMPGTGLDARTAHSQIRTRHSARGQRFVEGSWFTPMVNGYSRAFPARLPAFTVKSVACEGSEPPDRSRRWGAFLKWTRQQMDEAGREQVLVTERWLIRHHPILVRVAGTNHRHRALCPQSCPPTNCPPQMPTAIVNMGRKRRHPTPGCKNAKASLSRMCWYVVRASVCAIGWDRFVRDGLPDIPCFLIVVGGGNAPRLPPQNYLPCFFWFSALLVDGVWSPLPLADLLAGSGNAGNWALGHSAWVGRKAMLELTPPP